MKLKYIYLELAAILAFLVLPPIVTGAGSIKSSADYLTWTIIFQLLLSVLLDVQYRFSIKKAQDRIYYFQYLYHGALTLGLLMIIHALFQALAIAFPSLKGTVSSIPFLKPQSPIQWITFTLNIATASFYEESLYRQFLPEAFRTVAGNSRPLRLALEALTVLLFAFAHRYLGLMAVLNAALCGTVLRLCAIKTRGIYTTAAVHFIYNMLLYLFLFFV